jgi:energy-coupling factor transporter ATP-binding protein EcfA2
MPTAIEAPDSAPDLLTPDRPFPGPKPYVEAWKDYYHGRESELAEVSHLIRRGPLAVLFGASGLGKTSLLNAGVFPKLREEAFFPFVVRLDFEQRAVDLVEQVMQRLRAEVQRTEDAESGVGRVTLEGDISCSTLWEYFKTVELWSADWRLLTPVVVFDQFEEAFTKGQRTAERRAAVKTFFVALRDLAENHLPDVLARDKRFRRRAGRSDEGDARSLLAAADDAAASAGHGREDRSELGRDKRREAPRRCDRELAARSRRLVQADRAK